MASALGLGAKTGIETDYERPGIVPSDAWKRRERNEGWREGDTCNYSIGQGALVVTPLQMARVTAAIANGGFVHRPRLVLGLREAGRPLFSRRPPKMINNLHWDPAHLAIVQQGMHDVVMAPRGTGRLAKVPGVTVAGKTGTAEYGRKGSGNKYGWMIAYAPYEDPRYAVALVVDKAISGGVSAAPRVQRILEGIFSGADPRKGAG
jgi:penicillin-binding protein 2